MENLKLKYLQEIPVLLDNIGVLLTFIVKESIMSNQSENDKSGFSKIKLAGGEMVLDKQDVPKAWRPDHNSL